jgi:hypothetical protein
MERAEAIPGGVFRDARDGAAIRRDKILGKRRAEYALMPHTLRRVYVRRAARAVTGVVAAAGAGLLYLATIDGGVHDLVRQFTPGSAPAVLSTVLLATWIVAAVAYFVARSFAEDRYADRTSHTVKVSDDVFDDLERLSRLEPFRVAGGMATRLERASVALPIIGMAMLLPATALFGLSWLRAGVFPNPAEFELQLQAHAVGMLPAMSVLAGLALWFAQRLAGKPTAELESPTRLGDSVALGIGALLLATFGAALGEPAMLVGLGLMAFVVAAHVATTRVVRERVDIAVGS